MFIYTLFGKKEFRILRKLIENNANYRVTKVYPSKYNPYNDTLTACKFPLQFTIMSTG